MTGFYSGSFGTSYKSFAVAFATTRKPPEQKMSYEKHGIISHLTSCRANRFSKGSEGEELGVPHIDIFHAFLVAGDIISRLAFCPQHLIGLEDKLARSTF